MGKLDMIRKLKRLAKWFTVVGSGAYALYWVIRLVLLLLGIPI